MLINIGNHEFTEVWDGVLYKKLSGYPKINDWELRNIIEFIEYEKNHGRNCEIVCEDTGILHLLQEAISVRKVPVEHLIVEDRNAAGDPALL